MLFTLWQRALSTQLGRNRSERHGQSDFEDGVEIKVVGRILDLLTLIF